MYVTTEIEVSDELIESLRTLAIRELEILGVDDCSISIINDTSNLEYDDLCTIIGKTLLNKIIVEVLTDAIKDSEIEE